MDRSNEIRRNPANQGVSLFPSGLLMYDLPSYRRTASRISNHVEITTTTTTNQPTSPVVSVKIQIK